MALLTAGDAAASPRPGPLSGVPFTVKDNIARERRAARRSACPSAMGVARRRAMPSAVARLREAGAIFVGKTNLPAVGRRDRDRQRGLRADEQPVLAVALRRAGRAAARPPRWPSGCSAFGLGTDSGASVRLPAHFCGLAALKPTAGRVPIAGVFDDRRARGPAARPAHADRHPRALGRRRRARAVRDRGPSRRAALAAAWRTASADGLRVSVLADDGIVAARRRHRARRRRGRARSRGRRARVSTTSRRPAVGTRSPRRSGRPTGRTRSPTTCSGAGTRTGGELALRRTTSTSPLPGLPDARRRGTARSRTATSYTTPQNLSGWAAATVRCGTSADGLPIGVQVAAPPWRDEVALAAALALERALGGYSPPPAAALAALRRRRRGACDERVSRRADRGARAADRALAGCGRSRSWSPAGGATATRSASCSRASRRRW